MAIAPYEPTQEGSRFLDEVRSVLQDFARRFRDEALLLSTRELAEVTAAAEELSKTVEQLQIIGAHALDRQHIAAVGESDRPTWAEDAGPGPGTEFKDTAAFLCKRLHISRTEARRRLRLGADTLPEHLPAGGQTPPRLPRLGAALAAAEIGTTAATLIRDAVERLRPAAEPAALQAMEQMLTLQAADADPDFLRELIKYWEARLDPDGPEPTEEF